MKTCLLVLNLFSLTFLSGCSVLSELGVPKPTFALKDVKFGQMNLKTATLLFDVEVQNPYAVDLPLLNMDYALTTQQSPLFKGQADIATTIPAKEKKIVSLPITLGYTEVVNALKGLKDVRPGSMIPYDAAVGISSKAPVLGTIRMPIQKSGELKIPTFQDAGTWKSIFNSIEKIKSIQEP
jgi:LEA14-like dessication related protein